MYKKIIVGSLLVHLCGSLSAQMMNWQRMDLKEDGYFGISLTRTYAELLAGKQAVNVITAIIDSGVDTLHEDLKAVLWTDPVTGGHGWNYIAAESGREDITLLVGNNKAFYDSLAYEVVPEKYRKGYRQYKALGPVLQAKIEAMETLVKKLDAMDRPDARMISQLASYHLQHGLNVGNSEVDTTLGNDDVSPDMIEPFPRPNLTYLHGTHVAGILGAVRNNKLGVDGIADHVQIMMLKTNGNIRELRDLSLARAIRYATDHGAKVINMSFGKPYTWDKASVDEAVRYAMSKDVLLIHAAGNDGRNVDASPFYPNKVYLDNGRATAWIEVGASGAKDDATLAAEFSNYGQESVDVFAPGVDLYSCIPGSRYMFSSGTSMAAPVVAGVATLIREYYPKLTAVQVKDIIMKTVVKRDVLKAKCVSGGVINAYDALKLAETYK